MPKYSDSRIILTDVSPPAANTLGIFRIVVTDKNRTEELNFGDLEPIWIMGKVGYKADRIMRGIIDRRTPLRLAGKQWALEVAGRSWGAWADMRGFSNSSTDTNIEIRDIIINRVKPIVPELEFGNYVYSTGVTLSSYTIPAGASAWSILQELAGLASRPNAPWGVWDCMGQHAGETGPNIHFGPVKQETSLIPITSLQGPTIMAPNDYRQITTQVIVQHSAGIITVNGTGPGVDSAYSGSFNGTTSYVTFPDTRAILAPLLSFNTGDSMSLEAWIYPTSVAAGGHYALGKEGAALNTRNYSFGNVGTEVRFAFQTSDTLKTIVLDTSGAGLAVNNWYHVLISHKFGSPKDSYILLNGVKRTASWAIGTGYEAPYVSTTNPVTIGSLYTTTLPFSGYIDNAYIWPRFIGIDEAKQHYKGQFPRGGSVMYVPFEEGSGTLVYDKSGYGFVGTGVNLSWFNYGNIPNSQAKYGIFPRWFDRSFAGSAEATNFANVILRNYRDATRYVQAHIPMDLRLTAGQWVYVKDRAFRGRSILDSVRHIIDDNARTELVLVYI